MNRTVSLAAWSVLAAGEPADVSFVPPLVRRRLSPLQKVFFALANATEGDGLGEVVFASRNGEDTLTRRIVDDFHADGSVSPHRFSTSVYNAAPGLWSVETGNRLAYTAVAAGDDTVECGLIEALTGRFPGLFVLAEETGGGYGAAIRLDEPGRGRRVAVTDADEAGGAMTFAALVDFLSGRTPELRGRWICLRAV